MITNINLTSLNPKVDVRKHRYTTDENEPLDFIDFFPIM